MKDYKQTLSDLQKQSEQLEKDCSNALQAADQDVEKILSVANGLIDLNDNLFEKVTCIDNCLVNDGAISKKAVERFKDILKDDIAKQREYQDRISQYRLERDHRIQQRRFHNQDLER